LATDHSQLRPAKLLSRDFFNRDPRRVARELLGKLLVRSEGADRLVGRIVETEAYLGADDAAAHAAAGKTARNAVLFGPPGFAYVYLIYGFHFCLNVSCLPEGEPGGVLFRALQPESGLEAMARNRGISENQLHATRALTAGPGRLSQALGITRSRDNGKDMLSPLSDLQLMEDGFRPRKVDRTPRIGITKAAEPLFRYVIAGNKFISR
jgi:DNA-3-methyladenine glycosylase